MAEPGKPALLGKKRVPRPRLAASPEVGSCQAARGPGCVYDMGR